jgi:hypothetical protein
MCFAWSAFEAEETDMQTIVEKSIGMDGKVFAERRTEIRRRVLKGAVLSFNKGYSTFECVARNLSGRGALLSLCETFPLPSVFSLRVDGQPPRRAAIRWRSAAAMGVEFLPAP